MELCENTQGIRIGILISRILENYGNELSFLFAHSTERMIPFLEFPIGHHGYPQSHPTRRCLRTHPIMDLGNRHAVLKRAWLSEICILKRLLYTRFGLLVKRLH